MKQNTCSAVICQPGGREQKHDTIINVTQCQKETDLMYKCEMFID